MRKLLLICLALSVLFMVVGRDLSLLTRPRLTAKSPILSAVPKEKPNAECTKKCIKEGAKMVVVTDDDKKVLTIENPERLTWT